MKTSLQSFFKVLATHRVASTGLRGRRWGQAVLRGAALLAAVTAVCTGVGSNAHAQIKVSGTVDAPSPCSLMKFSPDIQESMACPAVMVYVAGRLTFTHEKVRRSDQPVAARVYGEPDLNQFRGRSRGNKPERYPPGSGFFSTRDFRRPGTYRVSFTPSASEGAEIWGVPAEEIAVEPQIVTVRRSRRVQRFRFRLTNRANLVAPPTAAVAEGCVIE